MYIQIVIVTNGIAIAFDNKTMFIFASSYNYTKL